MAAPVERRGWLASTPAEVLFLVSAIAQYSGAIVAFRTFDEVPAATVAWLRVIGAVISLGLLTRPWRYSWSRTEIRTVAVFGVLTALMNLTFYLALQRLPLGKGVTIEFIGPIAVAAWRTRSRRNAIALLLAAVGVIVLSGATINTSAPGSALGLVFIFLASLCWAGYIVVGYRVARVERGAAGLALGLVFGAAAIAPFAVGGAARAFSSVSLLGRCLAVGLLSNTIGYGIDQTVMRRFSPRRFALMLALLPVVALAAGAVALDQHPSEADLIGVVLVLVGVAAQDRT